MPTFSTWLSFCSLAFRSLSERGVGTCCCCWLILREITRFSYSLTHSTCTTDCRTDLVDVIIKSSE